jgi:hypothetical protein
MCRNNKKTAKITAAEQRDNSEKTAGVSPEQRAAPHVWREIEAAAPVIPFT